MQDKIILGILQFGNRTSYDIKKAIEGSTAFFYNASMGSIHPALKKLEAAGHVSAEHRVENGRAKKIYAINDSGRAVFSKWLGEGLPLEKFKDETLVRLFFFGNVSAEAQVRHISEHIAVLDQQIQALEVIQHGVDAMEIPGKMKQHALFQRATLDFGLGYFRFSKGWYEGFLADKLGGGTAG